MIPCRSAVRCLYTVVFFNGFYVLKSRVVGVHVDSARGQGLELRASTLYTCLPGTHTTESSILERVKQPEVRFQLPSVDIETVSILLRYRVQSIDLLLVLLMKRVSD